MSNDQNQQGPGYVAGAKTWYNKQYESWMPWVEDKFLGWFGENKTSYAAKGELDKTKITGDKNIDAIQDGINSGVTGQFKKGGVLEGVGNLASKEVINRGERKGKNDKGDMDCKHTDGEEMGKEGKKMRFIFPSRQVRKVEICTPLSLRLAQGE